MLKSSIIDFWLGSKYAPETYFLAIFVVMSHPLSCSGINFCLSGKSKSKIRRRFKMDSRDLNEASVMCSLWLIFVINLLWSSSLFDVFVNKNLLLASISSNICSLKTLQILISLALLAFNNKWLNFQRKIFKANTSQKVCVWKLDLH